MREVICPKCGSKFVDWDEIYDHEFNIDGSTFYIHGHCLDCHANLTWTEEHKFDSCHDIRVEED